MATLDIQIALVAAADAPFPESLFSIRLKVDPFGRSLLILGKLRTKKKKLEMQSSGSHRVVKVKLT